MKIIDEGVGLAFGAKLKGEGRVSGLFVPLMELIVETA